LFLLPKALSLTCLQQPLGEFDVCWGSKASPLIAHSVAGMLALRTCVMRVDGFGEKWSRCPSSTWALWSRVTTFPRHTWASLCSADEPLISVQFLVLNYNGLP
jgi:hypothetical protein